MRRDGDADGVISDEPSADDSDRAIQIAVNGVMLGTIDPRTIKARAQFDLEDAISSATPATRLLTWLTQYAGVRNDDVPAIREALADMEAWRILDLLLSIQEAVGKSLLPPKGYKRRSH